MTHTTHFIIVGHMVMEHSDNKRGNLMLLTSWTILLISSKISFHVHHLKALTPAVEHWLERETASWSSKVDSMKDILKKKKKKKKTGPQRRLT